MVLLPDRCHHSEEVWTYLDPLICFHIVEWYLPDNVLRQFGMLQIILSSYFAYSTLHIDLRGKHDQDWCNIHEEYITMRHIHHERCPLSTRRSNT